MPIAEAEVIICKFPEDSDERRKYCEVFNVDCEKCFYVLLALSGAL